MSTATHFSCVPLSSTLLCNQSQTHSKRLPWHAFSLPVIPHLNPHPSPSDAFDERIDSYEMVQTYGVVPENSAEPSLDADEARALLAGPSDPGTPSKADRHVGGHATLTSSVSNLSNTIIGSGA